MLHGLLPAWQVVEGRILQRLSICLPLLFETLIDRAVELKGRIHQLDLRLGLFALVSCFRLPPTPRRPLLGVIRHLCFVVLVVIVEQCLLEIFKEALEVVLFIQFIKPLRAWTLSCALTLALHVHDIVQIGIDLHLFAK